MTTELCVMGVFAAAAVIALCVRPRHRGAATRHFVATSLQTAMTHPDDDGWLTLTSNPDGTVTIVRRLSGEVADDGALSLTIDIAGFDIEIRERRIAGSGISKPTSATATIDFMAQERYHITYRRDEDEVTAAFNYRNAPGAHRTIT